MTKTTKQCDQCGTTFVSPAPECTLPELCGACVAQSAHCAYCLRKATHATRTNARRRILVCDVCDRATNPSLPR